MGKPAGVLAGLPDSSLAGSPHSYRVNPSDTSSHPLPHFVIRLAKRKGFNIGLRAQKIFGIRTAQTGRQD
ncbi:MAG: hypothetical protein ABSA44_04830 [Bacteroidota bacterium]|jgi:hypothetical protein